MKCWWPLWKLLCFFFFFKRVNLLKYLNAFPLIIIIEQVLASDVKMLQNGILDIFRLPLNWRYQFNWKNAWNQTVTTQPINNLPFMFQHIFYFNFFVPVRWFSMRSNRGAQRKSDKGKRALHSIEINLACVKLMSSSVFFCQHFKARVVCVECVVFWFPFSCDVVVVDFLFSPPLAPASCLPFVFDFDSGMINLSG